SGDRLTIPPVATPAFAGFEAAMVRCAKSFGPNMWQMRELYNISSVERLDQILDRLHTTASDDGYEARAFCLSQAIPHLPLLVIGSSDVLFGVEDPRYYEVRAAIHIVDSAATRLATEYFESLWNDPRVFILRSAVRLEEENITRLRRTITRLRN